MPPPPHANALNRAGNHAQAVKVTEPDERDSGGFGGNGEARRLEHALRSGRIQKLFILARWNGHSATVRMRKVARAQGVEVVVVP